LLNLLIYSLIAVIPARAAIEIAVDSVGSWMVRRRGINIAKEGPVGLMEFIEIIDASHKEKAKYIGIGQGEFGRVWHIDEGGIVDVSFALPSDDIYLCLTKFVGSHGGDANASCIRKYHPPTHICLPMNRLLTCRNI
jgi:hypothetical protein